MELLRKQSCIRLSAGAMEMSVQRSKPEAGNVEELGNTAGAHRVLFFCLI